MTKKPVSRLKLYDLVYLVLSNFTLFKTNDRKTLTVTMT